jgi:hypothetical protein
MAQDAKLYFPAKDPVFDLIADMKKQFGTSIAAATPDGFAILARTATVRDGGLQIGSAAAGGKFVLDVVGCMSVGSVDDTFKPDQALDKGVFEVEVNGALAALAKVASAGHATVDASPLWGAEPNGTWTRSAAPGGYLVYGYPLGADVTTSGFEMGTIPQAISRNIVGAANLFRVGLCVSPANTGLTSANRLVHSGAIVTGLFDANSNQDQGTQFCVGHVSSLTNASWLTRLASNALSVLTPKPLYACCNDFAGIGGLPDGWSPITPNSIVGTSVALEFTTQPPANTFADSLFTVVVKASNASGPVPGVVVTVSVDNNHGVPAGAVISAGNPVGTTRPDGTTSITVAVGKAGAFILRANGALSAVATQSKLSNQFIVQNK